MQHLCGSLEGLPSFDGHPAACQTQVRFFAWIELSHMLHRLCGPPSIPLSFNLAVVLPRRRTYRVSCDTEGENPPTSSSHRLQSGLTGYLILFAPLTFVPQRQLHSRKPSSPPAFLSISTHFTATPRIPLSSPAPKPCSFECRSTDDPWDFTSDTQSRLRTLYAQ